MPGKLQMHLLLIPLIAIVASCSPRPGVVATDRPVDPGPFRKLFDPTDYSETTTLVLQNANLNKSARSDPAAAIRHLVGNTPKRSSKYREVFDSPANSGHGRNGAER